MKGDDGRRDESKVNYCLVVFFLRWLNENLQAKPINHTVSILSSSNLTSKTDKKKIAKLTKIWGVALNVMLAFFERNKETTK